ncbi:MAG TPA: BTAD domain-containing putative transcriptional regulator [Candidatus Limnocylindrales bacterium]|nr:BTAD domain-containing putative transcriptional regulator [Candidatus Limnocylindrales bacterium]
MSAHSTLAIRLLGRVDVHADDVTIRIGGRHAQALMALLALRPRPRLRDTLAAELWPEAGAPSAASLRQALWLIRSSLTAAGVDADQWLEADQDTIGLHRDAALDLDVDSFERLATSGAPDDQEHALRVYAGDLLEGLGHECFAADRERLSDLYEDLLAEVAQNRLDHGDTVGARRAASELLIRDPLREEAHAVLIAAYGRTGSRSQVVRQYRRVCAILRAELAVAPLPETDAAYRVALAVTATRSRDRAAEVRYDAGPFAPVLVSSA